jgi:hypothetical protein
MIKASGGSAAGLPASGVTRKRGTDMPAAQPSAATVIVAPTHAGPLNPG